MTIATRVVGAFMRLPRATHAVDRRAVAIPMPDGAILRADHLAPREPEGNAPLLLVRCPYGRGGFFGLLARIYAERGFQVLVVSVRGTFGSGGRFDPFRQEGEDGRAVLAWMRAQPWYPGAFGTFGPSYLGLVQWAIADAAGAELRAMCAAITASEFRSQTYAGEAFSLENALSWSDLISRQEKPLLVQLVQRSPARLRRAAMHLPLGEADRIAVGGTVDFYQAWLAHGARGDAWWQPADFSAAAQRATAPVQMNTGWFDLFLPWQLADYERLVAAGGAPRLRVGPWYHAQPAGIAAQTRDSLAHLAHHLQGAPAPAPAGEPVQLYVQGANAWRGFTRWPPASTPVRFHLHAGKRLAREAPAESAPDAYRYDPADPTPSVGGPLLADESAGPRDNRALEARADVLVYTTEPLAADLEIIGTPEVELHVASSLEHADFFARICDVAPSGPGSWGKSVNVCDALVRVRPGEPPRAADGTLRIRFALWPTAHRFVRGHALRLQVSSGAHPRYARNLGTGEPLASGTRMCAADQRVFHDPARPSAIILPVTSAGAQFAPCDLHHEKRHDAVLQDV